MGNCLLEKKKKCPISPKQCPEILSLFCQACAQIMATKTLTEQLDFYKEQLKSAKASMVLNLLTMFPKDENKAKETFQKILRYAKEWAI